MRGEGIRRGGRVRASHVFPFLETTWKSSPETTKDAQLSTARAYSPAWWRLITDEIGWMGWDGDGDGDGDGNGDGDGTRWDPMGPSLA